MYSKQRVNASVRQKDVEAFGLDYPYFVDPDEARRMFDEATREALGISGKEFIRRYDAGEYADIPDDLTHRHIIELALLVPWGR